MSVSYYRDIFVQNEIYKEEEVMNHETDLVIASLIEKKMSLLNDNIYLIREYIVLSFLFKKGLGLDDRYNYIRGLIYSSQYISLEDFQYTVSLFTDMNLVDEELCRTAFSSRTASEIDENFIDSYINILDDPAKMQAEIVGRKLIKQLDLSLDTINAETEDDLELIENDYNFSEELDSYFIIAFDIVEKIKQLKNSYPLYVKNMMKKKHINKDSEDYEMVLAGMNDYYETIIKLFDTYFDNVFSELKKNSLNLALTI